MVPERLTASSAWRGAGFVPFAPFGLGNLFVVELAERCPRLTGCSPLGWAVSRAKGATTLQPRATPWELDPNNPSPCWNARAQACC
jgi:hypothetical protein